MAGKIRIALPPGGGSLIRKAAALLQRTIEERCGARVVSEGADLTVDLGLEPGMGTEGFKISDECGRVVRVAGNDKRGVRFVMEAPEGAEEACALLEAADQRLSEGVRQSWRWRTLLLRGIIDADLVRNDFYASETVEAALEELTTIYHAERAEVNLAPPTRTALPELLKHL